MIRSVNILGAQCNGTHAQHGERSQKWDPTQCIFMPQYVNHINDKAALIVNL